MPFAIARRLLIPLVILAVAGAGFALLVVTKPRSEAAPRTETVWSVAVQTIQPDTLQPMLTLFGRVETPHRSRLRAAVEAEIKAVTAKEGEQVPEGHELVRLDDREALAVLEQRRADVRDAEAAIASEALRYANDRTALKQEEALLALAQSEVKRAENLLRRNLGSEAQVDAARQNLVRQQIALESRQQSIADHTNRQAQVQARFARAQAQRDIAELDWQRTRILAPFRARIAKVAVAVGDRVRVGDTIVELYDLASLEARAQIPASHITSIRRALDSGRRLQGTAEVDGLAVELELDRLAGEVTKGSGGVEALFSLLTASDWLPVGRFITLRLMLPEQERVVALPRQALYGKDRVYRVSDNRLAPITVERVGSRITSAGEEQILITSPELNAGDAIVTTQLPNAIDGLRVLVVAPTP